MEDFEEDVEKAAKAFHEGGEYFPAHLPEELALSRERTPAEVTMKTALIKQHPIHGVFADVFDRLGGADFLYAWAAANPDRFISMFSRMTPALQPNAGSSGAVTVTVNTAIMPGKLDG